MFPARPQNKRFGPDPSMDPAQMDFCTDMRLGRKIANGGIQAFRSGSFCFWAGLLVVAPLLLGWIPLGIQPKLLVMVSQNLKIFSALHISKFSPRFTPTKSPRFTQSKLSFVSRTNQIIFSALRPR